MRAPTEPCSKDNGVSTAPHKPPPDTLKRRVVVLTMTESCNLSCAYCFERSKTPRHMDIQVAKNAVDHEFRTSDGFDEIEFDLFGGEPTIRQAQIRELVEWTYAQAFVKPFLFFLETNGTLIRGEFQDWLIAHRDEVRVGLSLDGTKATHDTNRSKSYDDIDIPFFVRNYPDQPVRMTVNNATIGNLFNDVVHLHSIGFSEVTATFAHGIAWDECTDVLQRECLKLCDFYLEHPELTECSIFDMNLPAILQPGRRAEKWCGTGTSMVSYGIDGKRYPCHTFQANTTGSERAISTGAIDFSAIADFRDPTCSQCLLEPVCPNCYGMNYVAHGDIFRRDRNNCWIVKIRALAVSYLRAKQIERNPNWKGDAETYHTIAAIRAIQSQLENIEEPRKE
jgi:uncharacterized protein